MKWDEVPQGATMSMTPEQAMSLRRGGTKTFLAGAVCGAVCLLALQSCSDGNSKTPDQPTHPPSATAPAHHTTAPPSGR